MTTALDDIRIRFAVQIAERRVEYDGLVEHLMAHVTHDVPASDALVAAEAIAAACLGEQHLWRDMGLRNRGELRVLFERHFAPLAADNTMDMRWKKFLYRRLCRWEGFASCRAPSCSACVSYAECFGAEL